MEAGRRVIGATEEWVENPTMANAEKICQEIGQAISTLYYPYYETLLTKQYKSYDQVVKEGRDFQKNVVAATVLMPLEEVLYARMLSDVLGHVVSTAFKPMQKAVTSTDVISGVVTVSTNQVRMGGRVVLVDENLSPTIIAQLKSEGFNIATPLRNQGLKDPLIIDWALKNNAIVVTNNIKDFRELGLTTFKVSEVMKRRENASLVVDQLIEKSQEAVTNPEILAPGNQININKRQIK
jgi:predicted nuclease of predicted toxin-antitoxin system